MSQPAQQRSMSMSFIAYLAMTFLTAVNDSMFRWLIVPVGKQHFQEHLGWTRENAEAVVLSLGLGCFMLPFVVFAPWAGWSADRFSKRSSIIWLKVAEIVLMAAGVWAIHIANVQSMFTLLFLIGAQAAFIGTAKLGIIPELVKRADISAANGLSGVATLAAVITGTIAGYALADATQANHAWGLTLSAVALIGCAVLGTVSAMLMSHVPAASPTVRFQWNLCTDSLRDIKLVMKDRAILRVTLGIVFFWSLASLAQMNIDVFVNQELADNVAEGKSWSLHGHAGHRCGHRKFAGGLVVQRACRTGHGSFWPLLMGLACILLYFTSDSPIMAGAMLMVIGLGGGLFNVPLIAYLQERSPHDKLELFWPRASS